MRGAPLAILNGTSNPIGLYNEHSTFSGATREWDGLYLFAIPFSSEIISFLVSLISF
jgi:hypothetical protein